MGKPTPSRDSIGHSFATVPTEFAHQIIDDLRVWDILKLARNERIDACIVSHPVCSAIFNLDSDTDALKKTRTAAQVYQEMFTNPSGHWALYGSRSDSVIAWYLDQNPSYTPLVIGHSEELLTINIHCVPPRHYKRILPTMRQRIHRRLNDVILRTGNTPWSETPELMDSVNVEEPYFTPFKIGGRGAFTRPWVCWCDTHSEEKEWLEAFVKVYRYLKGFR